MASTWQLRQQRAMKTSVPVNCPWGSARSCCVAPVHFRLPIAGQVLSLHVRAPLPVPRGPPNNRTNQRAVKRAAIPVDRRGAQHVPVVRPPSTFGRILWPGFKFSPRARAGPEVAVVDDEGVGLPGELFRPSRCRPPPRSSPRGPWSLFLRPHPDLTCQVPPLRHVAHACSRNEVIASRGADC
jgi:hypothetical protein